MEKVKKDWQCPPVRPVACLNGRLTVELYKWRILASSFPSRPRGVTEKDGFAQRDKNEEHKKP